MHERVEASDAWRGSESRALSSALLIVLIGIVLGAGYNYLGRKSAAKWGLEWIARDRAADMPTLAPDSGHVTNVDDPMAVPEGASGGGLPEIPDLDRPIQLEIGAFKQLFDAHAVLVVDARDAEEYAEGHIPGAINLPFDLVATDPTRLETLDAQGKAIVTYCGGGACELSLSLAEELMFRGQRKVLVYMGGLPEWVAAGYPVDHGAEATPEAKR